MRDMSLVDHLEELRTRLIRIAIIVVVSFFVCYGLGEELSEILLKPLRDNLGSEGKIVYLGILDKVLSMFQLSMWCSVVLSSPLWFRELWLFIKPALYDKEIKVVRPFIFVGFFLFCLGVAFGYFLVFPFTLKVMLGFGVQNVEASLSVKEYLSLSAKVLFFLGIMFQLPNVMLILGFIGVLSKKVINQYRRYTYVAFSIISALVTPPDVFTLIALMIPLCLLFELGTLGIVFITDPYRSRQEKKGEAPEEEKAEAEE